MQVTNNVFNSSAKAVLSDLKHAGLDMAVGDGRLRVWPVERLTVEHELLIQQYRDELVTLVRICDDGVQGRLAAFKLQLREAPEGSTPDFVFRPGTAYAAGVCFSCGAALSETRFGRCWRCSLAWRMAAGVPVSAELAAAHDGARVVA